MYYLWVRAHFVEDIWPMKSLVIELVLIITSNYKEGIINGMIFYRIFGSLSKNPWKVQWVTQKICTCYVVVIFSR